MHVNPTFQTLSFATVLFLSQTTTAGPLPADQRSTIPAPINNLIARTAGLLDIFKNPPFLPPSTGDGASDPLNPSPDPTPVGEISPPAPTPDQDLPNTHDQDAPPVPAENHPRNKRQDSNSPFSPVNPVAPNGGGVEAGPSLPAGAGATHGWCTMHVTQWQRNENGIGDNYAFDAQIYDAAGYLLDQFARVPIDANTKSLSLNSRSLDLDVIITADGGDDDNVKFAYGAETWACGDWATRDHQCTLGDGKAEGQFGYDGGKREGDMGFDC